mmetsp:Transcript_6487/g.15006  ORF Transcript_6487/g.15006 Transcript_6487/m.15006 type:complete len:214 (-) Transcript_6487:296-937(-)
MATKCRNTRPVQPRGWCSRASLVLTKLALETTRSCLSAEGVRLGCWRLGSRRTSPTRRPSGHRRTPAPCRQHYRWRGSWAKRLRLRLSFRRTGSSMALSSRGTPNRRRVARKTGCASRASGTATTRLRRYRRQKGTRSIGNACSRRPTSSSCSSEALAPPPRRRRSRPWSSRTRGPPSLWRMGCAAANSATRCAVSSTHTWRPTASQASRLPA